ncbi:unnamed protein product, partial [Polarella glacialis]
ASTTVFRHFSAWTRDWTKNTCEPVPRVAGGGLRNNFAGYVGMRLLVHRPVWIASIGRWRCDGDNQSHTLVLVGEGVQQSIELTSNVLPDDAGFAFAHLPEIELRPGVYDVLTLESAGGDYWLDEGTNFEVEDWASVVSSVYGTSLQALVQGSRHATYGPVNLRLQSQVNL